MLLNNDYEIKSKNLHIVSLQITPESRRKDVKVLNGFEMTINQRLFDRH